MLVLVLGLSLGCGGAPMHGGGEVRTMTLRESGWSDENRARLERALADLGSRPGRRVAVFDWDNTMIRGDVGDLVLAHMIETDRLVAPRWDQLALLTDAARAELAATCDVAPGQPLPTRGGASPCARALAHLAWRGTTSAGEPGFTTPATETYRATYGLMAQLLAGHTDEALRALTREAWARAEATPLGVHGAVGGVEVERFGRSNAPMVELARALATAGVEPWIVSASAQPLVEALAERVAIPRDRVIGVRMRHDDAGRVTEAFEVLEDGVPMITWYVGKRRWIERVIAAQPVFAAGDSDGDLAMLLDAEVRLVLDRHPLRVMCNALADPDGWIVQPLFHDPLPTRVEPYPCATYRDALGGVVDRSGAPLPDQEPPR